jgi:DNA-binding FrmR family transcriptional regulator
MTTDALKRACEDGSFCHDMAYAIAAERDSLKRALKVAIHEQGQQFKLREAAEAELAKAKAEEAGQ